MDRRWDAAPGSALLVSVLLRPRLPPDAAHLLSMAAGLAAVSACWTVGGGAVGLKWPNDVIVEHGGVQRKLAGILGEVVVDGGQVAAVVLGMGMNLVEPGIPAGVGLRELAGRAVARDDLLRSWLDGLTEIVPLVEDDVPELLERYRSACTTLGRAVRVELAATSFEGTAVDVDGSGALLVTRREDGRSVAVEVGDVVHLRAV
jgi:BirA family transcriptional regulator, biotin operon repressor / biotin---[acetyl-CoA-carboxylase] ligase